MRFSLSKKFIEMVTNLPIEASISRFALASSGKVRFKGRRDAMLRELTV